MLKPTFIFLLCFAVSLSLKAQNYSFKNYTTHEGLVQTNITDITQDKKGNIWIGTNGGISIFDGKNFTNYDDHDLLQSLNINTLLCDSNGVMWIATGNGLLKYTNNFEVFFKLNNSQNNAVTCLTTNAQNSLFFVCNKTAYEVKNNKVEKLLINSKLDGNIDFLAFDRDDNLWIITPELEIYRKSDNSLTQVKTPFKNKENKIGLGFIRLLGSEAPNPYFVTNFGTYWVREDTLMAFIDQYPQFLETKVGVATYVLQQDDSTLWVGGTVGLSKLTGNNATRYVKSNGFCDNSVSCVFTDKERNVWIGCTYNGVYKLSNEALFHLKPSNESIDLRHVSDIASLSSQNTLFSTWGKGLFLLNGDSLSKLDFPSPMVRYITCMFPMAEHTYIGWFGPGLWKLNNKTLKISLVEGFLKEEPVARIYKMGGSLVFQTLGQYCYVTDFNFNVKARVKLADGSSVMVLKDKIYQMNASGIVDVLDNNLQVAKKNIFPEISSAITELTCYRDNFLVGTFGQGLFMYNQFGKLVKKIDKNSGLNTNIITSLLVDGMHLFIGSNLGLIRADLPDLQSIKVFKESEGMFNWECRTNGLKKLPGGAIAIATTNGPYLYYPANDLTKQLTSGTLSIADFTYGENSKKHFDLSTMNTTIQIPETIEYKDNRIAITLKGVSQRNPDDIIYHYQLQGYDSMWIATANPVITFDDLEPGDYKMRAYITVGNFASKLVSVQFSIAKPLSGKLWFQALLVLFLSGLCWLLLTIGNRIYQKYIQSRMVSKLEADIAIKQELTAQSVSFARYNYAELSHSLKAIPVNNADELTQIFLKDISKRIEWLWKKDKISVAEFHHYFDELLADYAAGASVYHKITTDDTVLQMASAFPILQVFSIYLLSGLYQNPSAVFSLDSENKSNGHLLFRFYTVTHACASRNAMYHFLREAIEKQKPQGVTIDVIENLEFGNMIVAELNLQNQQDL